MSELKHCYQIYIESTPEKIFQALTEPEFTRQYFHATAIESDWQVGSRVVYKMQDGTEAVEGEVLEYQPPVKLVITWRSCGMLSTPLQVFVVVVDGVPELALGPVARQERLVGILSLYYLEAA